MKILNSTSRSLRATIYSFVEKCVKDVFSTTSIDDPEEEALLKITEYLVSLKLQNITGCVMHGWTRMGTIVKVNIGFGPPPTLFRFRVKL